MVRKFFLVAISLAFIGLLVVINIKNSGDNILSQPVAMPENHILVENIFLVHVMENPNSYMTLRAESAYFDNNTEVATLLNTDIEVNDGENHLTSRANRGVYHLNRHVSTSGDIHGIWNDLNYSLSPDGLFEFDMITNQGLAKDDVVLTQRNNWIHVKELHYDGNTRQVNFLGGVEMLINEDVLR